MLFRLKIFYQSIEENSKSIKATIFKTQITCNVLPNQFTASQNPTFNPDQDKKPYMQSYDFEPSQTDVMLLDALIKICEKEYHNFSKKYQVYKDFRDKGYVVNPGIKFGCDFAVYQKGPGIDHAPYMIQVYNKNDNISSTAVVLAGRLASSVKKQFILAIPHGKDKIDYLALDWWKAN